MAFLDIYAAVKGQVLVVPKKQVEFLWDLDEETYMQLMVVVKKLALHLRSVLHVPYVGQRVVGVDVPHAHVHLVPFSTIDEFKREHAAPPEPDHDSLADIAKQLAL